MLNHYLLIHHIAIYCQKSIEYPPNADFRPPNAIIYILRLKYMLYAIIIKLIQHPLIFLFLAIDIVFSELLRFTDTVFHQFKINRC